MTSAKSLHLEIEPYIYGLATVASVWAMGAGNAELLWSRVPALGLILMVLAISSLVVTQQLEALKKEKMNLLMGGVSAIATAIPFIFIAYLLKKTSLLGYEFPTPSGIVGVLSFSLLVAPASEIIYRKFIFPKWGLSTAAFVEALTLGFGSHYFFFFLAFFIMGHVWALLFSKYGLKTVIFSRALWTFIVFFSAWIF